MAATAAALDRSGFPPQSIGPMDGFEDSENFGNLVLDVPLPGWTLRIVRDRGSYELWFQTERGKAWHDLQHLLAAALDRPPGRADSITTLEGLQSFLTAVLPRLKDTVFDDQLEGRLREVREKAAEENLRDLFGAEALARADSVRAGYRA
jgi:hypothetical protein